MAVSQLTTLEVVLTAGCNLRCTYCYQDDKRPLRMEWPTLQAALDHLLSSPRDEVTVLFIGGEPLLEFPLIERGVAYVDERRRADMRVRFEVFTNGMLLEERHAAFFAEHDFELQLSFDGVAAAQRLRGAGTFERLDRLLGRLRRDHRSYFEHRVRTAATLLPDTIRWLPESVAYFLDQEVRDVRVAPVFTAATAWQPERIAELDDAFERVFDLSVRHYRRVGTIPFSPFRSPGNGARPGNDDPMCAVGAGRKLAVDVDGRTVSCVTLARSYQSYPTVLLRNRAEALAFGAVTDPALSQRFAGAAAAARATGLFHDRTLKYSTYRRCADCEYLADCSYCPVSIGHQPGNEDPHRVPDFICAYNLVLNKYRARFPRMAAGMEALLSLAPAPDLPPALAELLFGMS